MSTTRRRWSRRAPHPAPRQRRGVALVFVLVFVIAMAALAMASIFMAGNANLLAKSYDRERDLRFAAEAALQIGKSRVNADPSILVLGSGKLDTAILLGEKLYTANNQPVPGIKVNVYVGPTGSTSGQFGRFSSIVAEARDARGNGFIRRLELTQESFAKFAYWSNRESNGSQPIFFNNGDELWGPVWSNDTIHVGTGGATFHSEVGTAKVVTGAQYGTFAKGRQERQKVINLPSTAALGKLATIAASSGWVLAGTAAASNSETNLRNRLEFVAVNLNGANDSTDLNEGFFRYYTAKSNGDPQLRGDWPGATLSNVTQCGDFHYAPNTVNGGGLQFYPASIHPQTWFRDQIRQGYIDKYGWTAQRALDSANAEQANTLKGILDNPGARCYLAGDPHLVAVDRATNITDPRTGANYVVAAINKGGTDTTFTPVGLMGSWLADPNPKSATITSARPWDAGYLFALDRGFNPNAKGVIYTPGNVGLSGIVNGRVTLYAKGSIVLLDDVRYANDPVKGLCRDVLGIIAEKDVVIADNALNTPPQLGSASSPKYYSLDDTKDFYFHGVIMALGTSFRVQNYASGPTDVNDCNGVNNGRGCIYLSGGIIQESRGAVGTSSGTGYAKRYSYDQCAIVNPPPYFPTTGRFQDNRYLELDPAGFVDSVYFKSITPDP